ncbi:6-carboxyhexanoate--CoA ligase [Desertibacillus haloalkaliphilus]|uniref:6-carboxyhexanoate--CoA ligase n=1 Tax=Desertibacillus haloalkaliphilus TaxID=1328930 RepID=UPI001C25EDE2|nr:6-carboxyhexanoate--CoA ligase [Desertibacillus haloalkaliphilus]MBU8905337.1 6-carboxyhexanoate--CoA ligase [Desertibacillus haloalkaliphilus]
MQAETYFSVRMRASQNGAHEDGGKHISGGEVLTTYPNLKQAINQLVEKALTHSRGNPDFMNVQFEAIDEPIQRIKPLKPETNDVDSVEEGQALAVKLLEQAGVPRHTLNKVYHQMTECFGIRGAILVDVHSGERLDSKKGVRVSRMDWLNADFERWTSEHNLPNSPRLKEALTLASKVCHHPVTIAELCWSDDPDYVTGYVASRKHGYQRITRLKEYQDERGCRIFFVDGKANINTYMNYLEKQPIFVEMEGKQ